MENIRKLVKALSKKGRLEILTEIKETSMRNVEISKALKIRKERVSETLSDLMKNKVAIKFEKGSLVGEKHAFYVGAPLAKDLTDLDIRIEKLKKLLPSTVGDFGAGIGYLLTYYMETEVEVVHSSLKTKKGKEVRLDIKREGCGKEECEIVCEPIIKGVVNKFGRIDTFNREGCEFKVNFLYG